MVCVMEKQLQLVTPTEVAASRSTPIDWSLCILCRTSTSESLSQPWRGRGKNLQATETTGTSSDSFKTNLGKFQKFGKIPFNVCPEELNDGSGIAQTLLRNHAQWHKSCRNQFSDLKLERQSKRALETESFEDNVSPKKLRHSFTGHKQTSADDEPVCFFVTKNLGLRDYIPLQCSVWIEQFVYMQQS